MTNSEPNQTDPDSGAHRSDLVDHGSPDPDGAAPAAPAGVPPAAPDATARPVPTHGPAVAARSRLRRRRLYGLDLVDEPDLGPVLDAVLATGDGPVVAGTGTIDLRDEAERNVLPVLVTPNVDILVHLREHPDSIEADVFRRAAYVLPDGMPLIAASRLLRRPLRARLPGSGLFELLWPRLLADGRLAVMLCSSEEVVSRLDQGTGRIRFVVPPWFDAAAPGQVDEIVGTLLDQAVEGPAEFVLLGMGNPKDAVVAARFVQRWPAAAGPVPLLLGLGGSFAMVAGVRRRAPRWVQRIGMEWFYRFAQEPRRLFHRYFVKDLGFLPIVAGEVLARRRRRGR